MRATITAFSLAVALALGTCAAAWPGAAVAQTDARPKALELFRQGKTAYKAGDYDAALKFFRRAQAIYGHEPLIILALAKTFDRSAALDKSLKYYQLFLKEAPPDDRDRQKVINRIKKVKALLEARPGTLVLRNLPSAATVSIGGKDRGGDHRNAIELPAGSYDVKVTMKMRVPFERKGIVLEPGAERTLEVVLLEPVDQSTLPRDHTWTWVAGGATAAALVTSGGFFLKQLFVRQDWLDLFNENGVAKASTKEEYGCKTSKTTPETCKAMFAEGDRLKAEQSKWQDRAWIATGVAGGLAVVTVVAYLAAPVDGPPAGEAGAWLLQPVAMHRGGGVQLSIDF